MSFYVERSINESVEWLGFPHPFCDTGATWNDKLLCPSARWIHGVRDGDWAWGIQPRVRFGGVDVLCRGAVSDRAAYLLRSPENARATARVYDAHLWEHRLAHAQNLLHYNHIDGDERVNWSDDDWDDLWDEPADR